MIDNAALPEKRSACVRGREGGDGEEGGADVMVECLAVVCFV